MNYLAAQIGDTFFNQPGHFLTQLSGPSTLVSLFLSNSLVIAGIILTFILVLAGISFIGAGGNPQKVQAATKLATYGILGFLVVFWSIFYCYNNSGNNSC